MDIAEIKSQEDFNNLSSLQEPASFLQSWQWKNFQEEQGNKVFCLSLKERGEFLSAGLFIKKRLLFNKNYLYCPRGPVTGPKHKNENHAEYLFSFLNQVKNFTRKEKIVFVRFEPLLETNKINFNSSYIKKTIAIQPGKTLILDLAFSENELLEKMHSKTRYNIRLAAKKGVKVKELGSDQFDSFWDLMQKTSQRDGFRLHPKKHYESLFKSRDNLVKIFAAIYEDKIIAVNMVSFFANTATYVHGASDYEFRKLMAPYALQWHCIKKSKELGYKYYDFYGIDEEKWPGVTRFKKGFGGRVLEYPGTFDFIISKNWYFFYNILRKLRRMF